MTSRDSGSHLQMCVCAHEMLTFPRETGGNAGPAGLVSHNLLIHSPLHLSASLMYNGRLGVISAQDTLRQKVYIPKTDNVTRKAAGWVRVSMIE